jgi:hypothetical protein
LTGKKPKYMDIAEFRRLGFLQEINRLFLHPLGLALEVRISENGEEELRGIWDYRDDPEGMIYADDDMLEEETKQKAETFKRFREKKHIERLENLGYIIQEINERD